MQAAKGTAPEALSGATSEAVHGNLGKTLSRLQAARKRAVEYSEWAYQQDINSTERKNLNRTYWCGSYLWLRHYLESDQIKITRANFCAKYLQCPFCAILRARRGVSAAMERYKWVQRQEGPLRPFMVTLTVRNGDSLEERYNHLTKAWSRLQARRRESHKGKRTHSSIHEVVGGIGSIEIKRGAGSGAWHPHMHLVVLCRSSELVQADLASEWERITKDSNQVDVTPLRGETDEELVKSLCEVFKYALKFSSMKFEDVLLAGRTLKGRRMMMTFGDFRGVPEEARVQAEGVEDLEGQKYMEYMYEWLREASEYSVLKIEDSEAGRVWSKPPNPANLQGIQQGNIQAPDVRTEVRAYCEEVQANDSESPSDGPRDGDP